MPFFRRSDLCKKKSFLNRACDVHFDNFSRLVLKKTWLNGLRQVLVFFLSRVFRSCLGITEPVPDIQLVSWCQIRSMGATELELQTRGELKIYILSSIKLLYDANKVL